MTYPFPLPVTPLIGRQQEMATLCHLLRHPQVRLVTVTGPGGVGKTSLAMQAAHAVAAEFANSACFVSLATVYEAAGVVPTIARTLGLREEGQRPLLERLQAHLQQTQLLLLLDNFEQVIEAAPQVAALLSCPDLKIVVTSREILRLRGEHEFVVPLLPLPDLHRLAQLRQGLTGVLAQNTAVALFVERAQASKSQFQLTDANALTIARICAQLNGLPLALELAAARIKLFSPEALLIHLSQAATGSPLSLLAGGARDAPKRQQTLRDTIQWSYGLLLPAEQQLFRQLAVFEGSFSLAEAEKLLGHGAANAMPALLDSISALVDKSLLQPVEDNEQPRFVMLVMLRAFALEQLVASGEATAVRYNHAQTFLQLAETAVSYLRTAQQEQWLHRLEQVHDNLRAALSFLLAEEVETAVRLGNLLWHFWLLRGYLSEGQQWLEKLLQAYPATSAAPYAHLLNGAGVFNYYHGKPQRAVQRLEEALRLFKNLGDHAGVIAIEQGLARVAMRGGQFDQALDRYHRCLLLSRGLGDEWSIAHALSYLGLTHWTKGDSAAARPFLEEGLARFRQTGDAQSIAQVLQALAFVESSSQHLTTAEMLFSESLTICRALGDKAGTTRALYGLGLITSYQRKLFWARDLLAEALALLQELGDRYHFCGCLAVVTLLAMQTEQVAVGVQLWSAATHLISLIGSHVPTSIEALLRGVERQARTKLSESAFATAWAEGQQLSWEGAYLLGSRILAQVGGGETAVSPTTYPANLTEREVEVLQLVAQGYTNAQIAEKLIVSPYTVNAHLRTIYNKIDVPSRAAATRFVIEHHLL